MAVEARFYVKDVGKTCGQGGKPVGTVVLTASTKGPHDWSEWTPSGQITMGTLNADALAWFEARLGKDLAIVFDDVPVE